MFACKQSDIQPCVISVRRQPNNLDKHLAWHYSILFEWLVWGFGFFHSLKSVLWPNCESLCIQLAYNSSAASGTDIDINKHELY